jgi:hypothetical protein
LSELSSTTSPRIRTSVLMPVAITRLELEFIELITIFCYTLWLTSEMLECLHLIVSLHPDLWDPYSHVTNYRLYTSRSIKLKVWVLTQSSLKIQSFINPLHL